MFFHKGKAEVDYKLLDISCIIPYGSFTHNYASHNLAFFDKLISMDGPQV